MEAILYSEMVINLYHTLLSVTSRKIVKGKAILVTGCGGP
jgi:hypothetical protein